MTDHETTPPWWDSTTPALAHTEGRLEGHAVLSVLSAAGEHLPRDDWYDEERAEYARPALVLACGLEEEITEGQLMQPPGSIVEAAVEYVESLSPDVRDALADAVRATYSE